MIRAFKQLSIVLGGTPQPLVFTTLTAATLVATDSVSVAVADSSIFRQGEYAVFGQVSTNDEERHLVRKIVDGTHIRVNSLAIAHANGAYVRSGVALNSLYVQRDLTGLGLLYIGAQGLVKATFANVVATLFNSTTGQPIDFGDSRGDSTNAGDASDWWIDGTTGDKYLPSFGVT